MFYVIDFNNILASKRWRVFPGVFKGSGILWSEVYFSRTVTRTDFLFALLFRKNPLIPTFYPTPWDKGGAPPFRRWYASMLRPPFLASLSPKDPIIFLQSHPKTPYFFTKLCAVSQSHHCFRKIEILMLNEAHFWHFSQRKNIFFHQIWSNFHRNVSKLMKILIILTHFGLLSPDAPTFFNSLSLNAPCPVFGSLRLVVEVPPTHRG